MQYLGGKHQQARTIVSRILDYTRRPCVLVEPFCGACSVTAEAARQGFRVRASDAHPALVAMWQALLVGWRPAITELTEDQYAAAKELPDDDPHKALIGFGASFGGKYFGGYARGINGNYLGAAIRSCNRKVKAMTELVNVERMDYTQVVVTPGQAVYCDPPYRRTTGYSTTKFDSDAFWTWVRKTSEITPVFVTEFDVPEDAKIVHTFDRITKLDNINAGPKTKVEKLVLFDRTR